MSKYSSYVCWSEEDSGFIATCPEFPGVSAFGETAEAALQELHVALELAVETYEDEGWDLPEPQAMVRYSGQFRLRLPKSLHAALAGEAKREGVSLNSLIVSKLATQRGTGEEIARLVSAVWASQREVSGRRYAWGQIRTLEHRQSATASNFSVDQPVGECYIGWQTDSHDLEEAVRIEEVAEWRP